MFYTCRSEHTGASPSEDCKPLQVYKGFDVTQAGGRLKCWSWLDCCDKNEAVIASIVIGVQQIVSARLRSGTQWLCVSRDTWSSALSGRWSETHNMMSGRETNKLHCSNNPINQSSVPCFVFRTFGSCNKCSLCYGRLLVTLYHHESLLDSFCPVTWLFLSLSHLYFEKWEVYCFL